MNICKNCKHSILTDQAKFNPRYEKPFYSWNSEYACLKFATKCVDEVTGRVYFDGITSCKNNRESYILFPSLCKPAGIYFEKRE